MSLDIYITSPTAEAGRPPKAASLEWLDHEALRSHGVFDRGGVLARLADYYADARIYPAELEQAIRETKSSREQVKDKQVRDSLDDLMNVFQQALKRQATVYFSAD